MTGSGTFRPTCRGSAAVWSSRSWSWWRSWLASRLVYLQVFRHEDLSEQAESNRTAVVPIVPNRGLILDRNGVVLATNYSAYTLEITPSKVADLEQTIDELSKVVEIQPRDRRRFKKLQEESKSFESLPIRTAPERRGSGALRGAALPLSRRGHQGAAVPQLPVRRTRPATCIGYIGRINQAEKERIEESEDAANYRGTEYIGKLGVEQSYEAQLHGITGVEEIETSAGGRAMRRLASNPATPGNTVMLSIDIKLQKLVEDLFGDRRGALVAHGPARPARCWPSSASPPSTPTCSSTASTRKAGRSSTSRSTSRC